LIFSSYVKHLSLVKKALDQEKMRYCYLDGQTKNRQEVVDQFQTDASFPVFLISLKAGGVGLNLTAADYVFILDPWWNPAIENQAIDRAHRIGQKSTVIVYRFITKDSIEEKIQSLQERKRALADNLVETEEGFVKQITSEDVTALLA
jgi:SNF2 family DNA or RNA helicase